MKYAKETGSQKMTIKTTSYFAVAGYTVIFLAVLFSSEALNLFFTNKDYSDAKKIFPLIMMGQLFFGFQNIVDFGIYLHKKVHYYIIVALIGIFINVIMNFWLIPIYGFMASAYITVITYVITSYLIYLFSSRYYLFKLEWVRIVSPIFIIFILFFFINYTGFFINYAIAKKIMVLIFITSLFYKFWILPDEKKILKSAAKKIFN
jgi:O-antigen/teichoic acid export membrane protein